MIDNMNYKTVFPEIIEAISPIYE